MISPGELLTQAALALKGQKVTATLIAGLTAAICLTVLLVQGSSRQAVADILHRLDQAGSRTLTVTELNNDALVSPAALAVLSGAESVSAAIGVGVPRDVVNGAIGPGGNKVAAWRVSGDLSTAVELVSGRWPADGEAIVMDTRLPTLGLQVAAGHLLDVDGMSYPVVGSYRPGPAFADLSGVLVATPTQSVATLRLVIASVDQVSVTQHLALNTIRPTNSQQVVISSPSALAELQQQVSGHLGSYTGMVTALSAIIGALLIGVIVSGQVLLQAADLGRRRALGADRRTILAFVILRSTIPAALGALVGCYAAVIVLGYQRSSIPWVLVPGTACLALATALLAALGPAFIAAYRDPVRVLRTP